MSRAVISDAFGNHVEVEDADTRPDEVIAKARALWRETFLGESE